MQGDDGVELWNTLVNWLTEGKNVTLVTVIERKGSSPRGVGARMLVSSDGCEGTVGGGTVEYEARKTALALLGSVDCLQKTYGLSLDRAASLGMICGGEVTLLYQGIPATAKFVDLFRAIAEASESGEEFWTATEYTGQTWEMQVFSPKKPPDFLEGKLPEHAGTISADGRNWYLEPLTDPGIVYVFGGGHLSQALIPLLTTVGFRCVVADDREEFSNPERFPQAEKVTLADFSDLSEFQVRPCDYVVVMTRGHQHDYHVLSQMLRTGAFYVGMIGSRKKIEATFQRLREDGFSQETLEKIHTPIGLAIKAETPEEIAVSITAEMILERAKRRGSSK